MTEKPTEKPKLELVDTPPPDSIFNDIEALRRTTDLKVVRRTVQVNVSVGKPKNNIYFRCHPDPALMLEAWIVPGNDGSDDIYYVTPAMKDYHVIAARRRRVTIATVYAWPAGIVSLWPVPNPGETRIACWKSARVAFERSQTEWVQMVWDGDKRDYNVVTAEGINTEPLWPSDLNFSNLLKIGFAEKIIDTPEHSYVLQLRGLAK